MYKEVDVRPELDEEIDFLSSIITKHRESEMKHTGNTFFFTVFYI